MAPRRFGPRTLGGVQPQRILDTFGRVRSEVSPDTFPWAAAGQGLYEKARQIAEAIQDDPDAQADLEATMRLSLERARDSQDPRDRKVGWVFAVWVSEFTELREQVRGLRRPPSADGDKPCSFHVAGRNSGKRAAKHDFRKHCAECRHLDARAGPRPAARPESTAEILGGIAKAGR